MKILGKSLNKWIQDYPFLDSMIQYKEVLWFNPNYKHTSQALKSLPFSISDIIDADARLRRFAPFLKVAFPETEVTDGIIESELIALENFMGYDNVFLKGDHALPISGSVKARGGIYEILRYAEELLIKNDLLKHTDDYTSLMDLKYKKFLSNYNIVVSSTGNLGLSIGIISAKLGFKVNVHMSHDAMTWKKDLLKSIGATVIEHDSDYSKAVEIGRASAEKDPNAYFVDDENSKNLFLGYAVSALRLKEQFEKLDIHITLNQPLFVYIPCGVGGGPGGIAYGLKEVFGDRVHCIFVEPTHAPCMMLGMMTKEHDKISVQDFNIDNITIADGLAVGRASKFVGKIMEELLLGISTVDDQKLLKYMKIMKTEHNIFLEPSAVASIKGFEDITNQDVDLHGNIIITQDMIKHGYHVLWATGGNMVPESIQTKYFK